MSGFLIEKKNLTDLRPLLAGLRIGEVVATDVSHLNPEHVTNFLTNISDFSTRRYKWKFDGAELRVRRDWDDARDQWGLWQLELNVPSVVSGALPAQFGSVRATASTLRRKRGIIIQCKTHGEHIIAMLIGRESLPRISHAPPAPAPMTAEEFAALGTGDKRQRAYRFPIEDLDVGGQYFIGLPIEPSAGKIRVYCHYHGQRLGRKFSVSTKAAGHTITRTA
jgi:hypothetical protein